MVRMRATQSTRYTMHYIVQNRNDDYNAARSHTALHNAKLFRVTCQMKSNGLQMQLRGAGTYDRFN